MMLGLVSFVYTTWTQRIWPEIRVPEADPGPDPDWTPVSPDVLSAPELVRLWEDFNSKLCNGFTWLKNLRYGFTKKTGKYIYFSFWNILFLGKTNLENSVPLPLHFSLLWP